MKIRIKFAKHGVMKFVGHLDIMRYFQKAMRRAKISICYSEGFSPHQIMSFAAPLGLGLTSNGEYLDIEVSETESSERMKQRLNEVMADGMEIISFKRLDDNAGNAMSIVAAADYTVTFREEYKPDTLCEFFDGIENFYAQDEINVIKKTKKGEKEMNIRPYIYQLKIENNTIFMQLASGSAANIKPELVMDAYLKYKGMELSPFAFQIQREEVYADLGDENNRKLVALEELGEEIE